ncbi:MAG: hypothetical protein ACE14L_09650 [Terriglobales bacterium]
MRIAKLLLFTLVLSCVAAAECVPFEQARSKIGATTCVTGKVLKVAESRSGNLFLDFCKNYRECPFTVFVPRKSLRDVGNVRLLEGKVVEIHGRIREYAGRAEIILNDIGQLKGDSGRIPPLPKDYDAQRKGGFSAGSYSGAKSRRGGTSDLPPLPAEPKQPE